MFEDISNSMKSSILLVFLAVCLLLVGTTHAYTYSSITINASINQTSPSYSIYTVHYTVAYFNNSDSINISLPYGSYGFKVLNANVSVKPFSSCAIFASSLGCETYQLSGVSNGEMIRLEYYYKETFSGNGNMFNSSFGFIPPAYVDTLSVSIILPSNSFIPVNMSYSLPPQILVSNGRTQLYWQLYNVTYYRYEGTYPEFVFAFRYQKSFPAEYSFPWYGYIIIIAAALVIVYFIYRRRKTPPVRKMRKHRLNPFFSILTTDEKKLLGFMKRGEFMTQKELTELSGFSKAKVSKMISKMSKYRLVKVKPDGKFNRIKRM